MTTLDIRIKERIALYEASEEKEKLRELGLMLFRHAMRCEYSSDEMQGLPKASKDPVDVIRQHHKKMTERLKMYEEECENEQTYVLKGHDSEYFQELADKARRLHAERLAVLSLVKMLEYLLREMEIS